MDDGLYVHTNEPIPGVRVVRPEGEIDMTTAPTLLDAVTTASRNGARMLVIDLDDVTFLGSAGLAALIRARRAVEHTRISVCLAGGSRMSRRVLEISGVSSLFDHHPTMDAALSSAAALQGPSGARTGEPPGSGPDPQVAQA